MFPYLSSFIYILVVAGVCGDFERGILKNQGEIEEPASNQSTVVSCAQSELNV
jgi:hypothetical protein